MTPQKDSQRAATAVVAVKKKKKKKKKKKTYSSENELAVALAGQNEPGNIAIREVVKTAALSSAKPPSLAPFRLPYPAQHDLLLKVQDILERACFDFAQRKFPDVVRSRGWTAYQCVELTRWTRVLPHYLADEQVPAPYGNILSFFSAIRDMRNTVVHRHHRYATKILRYLQDSKSFALMLGDRKCWETLDELAMETQDLLSKLYDNIELLERKHQGFVEEINNQREALRRLESTSWETAKQENLEYQRRLGESFSETINSMDGVSKKCPLEQEQSQKVIPDKKTAFFSILRWIWSFFTRQVDDEVVQPESSES